MIFKILTPSNIHVLQGRVRKSRIKSCFARLESDMVRHHEICGVWAIQGQTRALLPKLLYNKNVNSKDECLEDPELLICVTGVVGWCGGWSGGAMVLGKLPGPGRPTILITVGQGPIALAVGAGGGGLDIFTLIYPFSSFSLSLGDGPI